jgi:hypothetical protein
MRLNTEQLRILEDTAIAYDRWISAHRELAAAGPPLQWKSISGKQYLYERRGNDWGSSHGVRAPETEAQFEQSSEAIGRAEAAIAGTDERLAILAAQYRALRLPRVHPTFGAVCREADRRGLLGSSLLVVGTNAMPAYEIEAQERFADHLTATQDCDFAWAGPLQLTVDAAAGAATPFYSLLKAVDSMFTVNQERPWQARNAEGYEVEILLAPSRAGDYPARDPVRPVPMPEQDWLLNGKKVSHVVFDLGNRPVRIVAPDPRWMALHKLWLSTKPNRNPLKAPKDRAQGELLARQVVANMKGFPIDGEFKAAVPELLRPFLAHFTP